MNADKASDDEASVNANEAPVNPYAGSSSRWSTQHIKFVEDKFADHIKRKQTPLLRDCGDLGIGKTAKQVQDKVRSLIRSKP